MAVLDNGDCAGSFSSGCVEAAIIAEAIEVFSESRPRVVRFGQGSPYLDIKLPCGGGIDALFLPAPSTDVLELALDRKSFLSGKSVSVRVALGGLSLL